MNVFWEMIPLWDNKSVWTLWYMQGQKYLVVSHKRSLTNPYPIIIHHYSYQVNG